MGQNKILDADNNPVAATMLEDTYTGNTINGLPCGKVGEEVVLKVTPIGGTPPTVEADVNIEEINGVAPDMGTGASGTGTLRVALATDGNTTNLTQLGGTAIATGVGNSSAGTQRVVLASDGVNNVAIRSGGITAANQAPSADGVLVETGVATYSQQMLFNGSGWDRSRGNATGGIYVQGAIASGATDSGNPVKVGGRYNTTPPTLTNGQRGDLTVDSRQSLNVAIRASDSASYLGISPNVFDGTSASTVVAQTAARGYLFNGTDWDRYRSNMSAVLLASAARTTTQTSADIINYNGRGLQVVLDMTVVGTGSVTVSIQGKDANGIYYTLLTGAPVITNSTNVYHLGPEITAVANQAVNLYVPRTFRIVVTANNGNTATYSVAYNLNL
jgi:hypothetical protein